MSPAAGLWFYFDLIQMAQNRNIGVEMTLAPPLPSHWAVSLNSRSPLMLAHSGCERSAATIVPVVCRRFAQLCEIGPIDFFRSLYVDSTIQGDFGHVVRSSMGCLGSEIFWVMCLNLHIPDNAEKHCFEHKSQFLNLKY